MTPAPHNPVHSQEDWQQEPTADNLRDSTTTSEPVPTEATELNITVESGEGVLVKYSLEVSPAHPPSTESEILVSRQNYYFDFGEVHFFELYIII